MIVFLRFGRLGNQLFQYAALRTAARPGERIVLLGCKELTEACDGIRATVISSPDSLLVRLLTRSRPALNWAARRARIAGYLGETGSIGVWQVSRSSGLLPFTWGADASFQWEQAFSPAAVKDVRPKDEHVRAANAYLNQGRERGTTRLIFVHVRRGDYVIWPSPAAPAVLPAAWYWARMEDMVRERPGTRFVIVTDDVPYARDVFGLRSDCHIHSGTPAESLAVLAGCDGGILSASTFAWWGAYFLRRDRPGGRLIAPQYWAGHSGRRWLPESVMTEFLEYAPVHG